jgi:hypothetical protein
MGGFSVGHYTKGSIAGNQPFGSLGIQHNAKCHSAMCQADFEAMQMLRYNPQKEDRFPISSREFGLSIKGAWECRRIPK